MKTPYITHLEKMLEDAKANVTEARTNIRDRLACADLAGAAHWEKRLSEDLAWEKHCQDRLDWENTTGKHIHPSLHQI